MWFEKLSNVNLNNTSTMQTLFSQPKKACLPAINAKPNTHLVILSGPYISTSTYIITSKEEEEEEIKHYLIFSFYNLFLNSSNFAEFFSFKQTLHKGEVRFEGTI